MYKLFGVLLNLVSLPNSQSKPAVDPNIRVIQAFHNCHVVVYRDTLYGLYYSEISVPVALPKLTFDPLPATPDNFTRNWVFNTKLALWNVYAGSSKFIYYAGRCVAKRIKLLRELTSHCAD